MVYHRLSMMTRVLRMARFLWCIYPHDLFMVMVNDQCFFYIILIIDVS